MQQTYNLAVQAYRAGNIAEAEAICRQILLDVPDHVDALRLLGLLTLQAGRNAESQQLLRRAVALAPNSVQLHNDLGTALAASGQLNEAIGAFRSAWQLGRQNPDVAGNLGMALLQTRAFEEAAEVLAHAAVLRPNDAGLHIALGDARRELEQFPQAINAYRAAAGLDARNPQIQLRLGMALKRAGQTDEAVAAYRRAGELSPQLAEAHFNLGNALKEQKNLREAAEAYSHALIAKPNYADAMHNLATVFDEESRWDDAAAAFRQVTELRPDFQPAFHGLGKALRAKREFDEAIPALRRAVALDPTSFESLTGLADCLKKIGSNQEAIDLYRRALQLQPDDLPTLLLCGELLDRTQKTESAIELFRRALAICPGHLGAELNLSLSLLRQGHFEDGWRGYELRWHFLQRVYDQGELNKPLWNGENLDGRRLLIHVEQGMGDLIQFVRYVPVLLKQGAQVIMRCPQPLRRLFSQKLGLTQLLTESEPLPDFDFQLPLMSLPRVMGTTLDNVPANVPYLMPPSELVETWRQRLSSDSPGLKVGLAWAGNPSHDHDRTRSMPFAEFAPLSSMRNATFYSLQKGPGRDQIGKTHDRLRVTDLADELHDFADTAAAMLNLDLVLSVDTAVAHLGGALGRPTWLLLADAFEWRWLQHRSDSPWYPTMRLFHQKRSGDWTSLLRDVVDELRSDVRL